MTTARIYRFGSFELDGRTRRLRRDGRPVAIQPKPLELLLYLIHHRAAVVTREELLAAVWPGVRVNPQAVGFALHALRKAVDDDGDHQEVIRTVPRAGLQFIADVEELAAETGGPGAGSGASALGARAPFLGRDRLVTEARSLLAEAARGRGGVLLLSGEAGIGKTRALDHLAQLAGAQGFQVLQGRCVESEGAPSFWPWVQILRAAVQEDPDPSLLRVLGEGAREVAWMVPELRPFASDPPEAPPLDARAARFLLFDSVTTFLRELVARAPHVLCIDDLHRSDPASIALFGHVAQELGELRLALLATYRERELRLTPALAEPLTSVTLLPHCRHEALHGLEQSDVRELVSSLTGRAPSEAVIADLHEKTSGNPFFLDQVVRVLGSEGRLADLEAAATIELELPRHVQDAIRRQVQLLSDTERAVVELASVIGREFTTAELEGAVELDREAILARLGAAIEAGVISEPSTEPHRHRFAHALVRDAIYTGLPLEARARMHARVARSMHALLPARPGAECAALAHHYSHSLAAEDLAQAIELYEMAAEWSTSRGAFEDAPSHLERALGLLEERGLATDAERCRLLIALGDALTNAGARDRAREALQSAAAIAKATGLREELALAALRFAPDFLAIETGVYDAELVQLLQDAIDSLEETEPLVRARLLARLAVALHWNDDQIRRRESACAEAQAIASREGDPETEQYVRTAISFANFSVESPERYLAEVPDTSDRSGTALGMLERLTRITSLMLLARVEEADAEIQRFEEIAIRTRDPQARWYSDLMRATRAQMDGRYQEAARLAQRYLALGSKIGDRNALQSYLIQTLMGSIDTGGVEGYESEVRTMVARFPRMTAWRAGLLLYLIESDRLDEARIELHGLVRSGAVESRKRNEWYATMGALALSCGALDERSIAAKVYEVLLPHSEGLVVVGYCSYCLGSTQHLLAILAATMKEHDLAGEHFERARDVSLRINAHGCVAKVYLDYGKWLWEVGREHEARECANAGGKLAAELGMRRVLGKSEFGGKLGSRSPLGRSPL